MDNCTDKHEERPSMTCPIQEVSPKTAHDWLTSGKAVIVDVREAGEYEAVHIPKIPLVALSAFDTSKIPSYTGKKLVVHCRSGARSANACHILAAQGFEDLYNMTGGILAWQEAGLPVETADHA